MISWEEQPALKKLALCQKYLLLSRKLNTFEKHLYFAQVSIFYSDTVATNFYPEFYRSH